MRVDDRPRTSDAPLRLPLVLHAHDGAMTRELLLRPGRHGLGMTPQSLEADATTTATCGYCSTGCGLRMHLRQGEAVGVTPETDYPVNMGMACPKGWESLRVLETDRRATTPLLKDAAGVQQPVAWPAAMTAFCSQFQRIQSTYGSDSVAFLSTGQLPSEEMAFLGALAKFGMGCRHGDGNTRQCMATAVTAYKESFGFDAPPYTYEDFEQSDCLVFIGANPCVSHPIMWERVLRNQHNPDLIVFDPRCTETAMAATEHLQIAPKSDLLLWYAITNTLIQRGLVDQGFVAAHTNGYEELCQQVAPYTLAAAAERSGVAVEQLERVVEAIANHKAVSFWWTMGVNQSYEGTRTAQAIINVALLTGNIGRPGTGANSITGQCNAMGSRMWSNTTSLLGQRSFGNPDHRQEVADILGIDVERVPSQSSWSYDRIIEGVRDGSIKGLWVIATNPAHSWIDQADVRDVLGKLEFLVVQDMYADTETAQLADLVLPAAAWGEKDGTFINSERRYGLLKKVRPAPGEALADFQIFRAVAHYWGCEEMFAKWRDAESVFQLLKQLSAGRPCDISGIENYAQLDAEGGIQWPWTAADALNGPPAAHRRLFGDGQFYREDGRARLIVDAIASPPETPCKDYPLWLLTGRGTVSQWHTQTRTSASPILRQLYPNQAYLEIHPDDAADANVSHGSRVVVRSRRGAANVIALVTPTVGRGQTFMPMHYEETNVLTLSHFDPHSRQPSYKDCAVSITRFEADS